MTKEYRYIKEFCYLGDRLNASGRCTAAVTVTARLDG